MNIISWMNLSKIYFLINLNLFRVFFCVYNNKNNYYHYNFRLGLFSILLSQIRMIVEYPNYKWILNVTFLYFIYTNSREMPVTYRIILRIHANIIQCNNIENFYVNNLKTIIDHWLYVKKKKKNYLKWYLYNIFQIHKNVMKQSTNLHF